MPEAELIRWTCACGKALKAPAAAAGKGFTCSRCGARGSVPTKKEPASIVDTLDFSKLVGTPVQRSPAQPPPDTSLDDGFGDDPVAVEDEPSPHSKPQAVPPAKEPTRDRLLKRVQSFRNTETTKLQGVFQLFDKRSYKVVRAVANLLLLAAILGGVFAAIFSSLCLFFSFLSLFEKRVGNEMYTPWQLQAQSMATPAFYCIAFAIPAAWSSEWIKLFLDLEENTRLSSERLLKLLERNGERPP